MCCNLNWNQGTFNFTLLSSLLIGILQNHLRATRLWLWIRPGPRTNMLRINPVVISVLLPCQPGVDQPLSHIRSSVSERFQQINCINGETVPIRSIAHGQLKRRVDVAFLSVASDMQVLLTGSLVGQPVDEPRV